MACAKSYEPAAHDDLTPDRFLRDLLDGLLFVHEAGWVLADVVPGLRAELHGARWGRSRAPLTPVLRVLRDKLGVKAFLAEAPEALPLVRRLHLREGFHCVGRLSFARRFGGVPCAILLHELLAEEVQ